MSVAAIAAVTALVAGGITAGLIAILHVLEPEYDPSWRCPARFRFVQCPLTDPRVT